MAYEEALNDAPGHEGARKGLARLYADQIERARERRAELERIYFEELLKQLDDADRPGRPRSGALELELSPPPDELTIAPYEQHHRRLVPGEAVRLDAAPERVLLATGNYLVSLRFGEAEVRAPVVIRADRPVTLRLDIGATGLPFPGEVLVPGGPALLGDDDDEMAVTWAHHLDVPTFFIQARPVTFGAYLEFLAEALRADPKSTIWMPRARDRSPFFRWDGDGFVPGKILDLGITPAQSLTLPVFGVDVASVEAYIAWYNARTGRPYRLPTDLEWEKAGRGVDGRRYPWGERFDASFCKMHLSRPGLPAPEPVGTFAADVSPYGVIDLAGGVADWVVASSAPATSGEAAPGGSAMPMATRGGAWCDSPWDCRLTSRRPTDPAERSVRIGFRLARSA